MRQLLTAWLTVGLLAVSSAAFGQVAFDGHVKVGVLNDQSSLYADATGQGSVVAAQMALEDYMKANPNSKLKWCWIQESGHGDRKRHVWQYHD